MSPEEFAKLRGPCSGSFNPLWWELFITTCFTAGLRRDEAVHLTWADIEFDKGLVRSLAKQGITDVLEETPPELVADILTNGILLAGGSSQLRGLDKLISEATKMSVWIAKDPQTSVVRGCGKVLEDPKLLKMVKVVGGLR